MDKLILSEHALERVLERCISLKPPYTDVLKDKAREFFSHVVVKSPFEDRWFLEDFNLEAVVKNNIVVTVRPYSINKIPYEKLKQRLKGSKK